MHVDPLCGMILLDKFEEYIPALRAAYSNGDYLLWVAPVLRPETLDMLDNLFEAGVDPAAMKVVGFKFPDPINPCGIKAVAGFIIPAKQISLRDFHAAVRPPAFAPRQDAKKLSNVYLLLENLPQVQVLLDFHARYGLGCPGVSITDFNKASHN